MLAVLLGGFAGEVAYAGAYAHLLDFRQEVNGFCAQGTDKYGNLIYPYAIAHPPGYDGTQSVVNVSVCVFQNPPHPDLTPYVANAIATWNALTPTIGNCGPVCALPEDPAVTSGGYDLESVVLHELAHALGLGHPNLRFRDPVVDSFLYTSFSAAYAGAAIGVLVGADGVRGSRDDFMDDLFGSTAVNVNWFREWTTIRSSSIRRSLISTTSPGQRATSFPPGAPGPPTRTAATDSSLVTRLRSR